MTATDWIALTWEAQTPRVTVMAQTNETIAAFAGPIGMVQADLPKVLSPYLRPGGPTPVVCAGFPGISASSYRAVPAVPLSGLIQLPMTDPQLVLHMQPGLRQNKPADMMLGDETAIGGFLAADPGFDGVICTVRDQTVWSHISAGEIVSFQSFLTPALMQALEPQMQPSTDAPQGPLDPSLFAAAVDDIMARPQTFGAALAQIRADAALNALPNPAAWSRLIGALIGLELSGARPYWLGQRVAIIGDGDLPALYAIALTAQGVEPQTHTCQDLMIAGLTQAWHQYRAG